MASSKASQVMLGSEKSFFGFVVLVPQPHAGSTTTHIDNSSFALVNKSNESVCDLLWPIEVGCHDEVSFVGCLDPHTSVVDQTVEGHALGLEVSRCTTDRLIAANVNLDHLDVFPFFFSNLFLDVGNSLCPPLHVPGPKVDVASVVPDQDPAKGLSNPRITAGHENRLHLHTGFFFSSQKPSPTPASND